MVIDKKIDPSGCGNRKLKTWDFQQKIRKSDTKADVQLALERLETIDFGIKVLTQD